MPDAFDTATGETFAPAIEHSAAIGALMAALAKAQGEIRGALKDSTNPHFKSKYADLQSVWEACRDALAKNQLAVVQSPFSAGKDIGVVTILGHSSGEWIRGALAVAPMKFDAQGAGSVITYLRRYALASMVGVAPAEDDGEAALGRPSGNGARHAPPPARAPTVIAPARVEPPHHPETGELGPHTVAIPVAQGGGSDWISWGRTLIAGIKSAASREEVDSWALLNGTGMGNAEQQAPKAYKSVQAAFQAMREKFPAAIDAGMLTAEDAETALMP